MQRSGIEAFCKCSPPELEYYLHTPKRQTPVSLSLSYFWFQVELVLDIKYISNTEEMYKIFLGDPDEHVALGLNKPEAGPNPSVL